MQLTVDTLTWLLQAIDGLMTVGAALLPVARAWGFVFAILSLIVVCFKGCIHAIQNRNDLTAAEFIFWVGKVLFVSFALGFYNRPIPGIGVAFPDIFPLIGTQIAQVIGVQTLDRLLDQVNAAIQGLEHPPLWNFFALFIYFFVLIAMVALDTTLLVITSLGFFAIGLGKVFGSILITFYLVPGWSQKFWTWVNFMFVYSFYRAVAAAFVFVASTFLLNFFQNSVAGDYTLGHWIALFSFMITAIGTVIVGAFKVPHFTVELFGGGLGHAAADFGQSIRSLIFMIVRR